MAYDINAFGRMSAADRKVALGLDPKKRLPDHASNAVTIHGINLFLVDNYQAVHARGQSRNKPQRVVAACPVCGWTFSAGNLAQHYNVHTESGREWLRRKAERRAERVRKMETR